MKRYMIERVVGTTVVERRRIGERRKVDAVREARVLAGGLSRVQAARSIVRLTCAADGITHEPVAAYQKDARTGRVTRI
jgi:hypothetical protein